MHHALVICTCIQTDLRAWFLKRTCALAYMYQDIRISLLILLLLIYYYSWIDRSTMHYLMVAHSSSYMYICWNRWSRCGMRALMVVPTLMTPRMHDHFVKYSVHSGNMATGTQMHYRMLEWLVPTSRMVMYMLYIHPHDGYAANAPL